MWMTSKMTLKNGMKMIKILGATFTLLLLANVGVYVQGNQVTCDLLNGGVIDEATGECIFSLDDKNSCLLNVETFDVTCDPYCINAMSSQWLDDISSITTIGDEMPFEASGKPSKVESMKGENSNSISVVLEGAAPVTDGTTKDEISPGLDLAMISSNNNNSTTTISNVPFCGTASCQNATDRLQCMASLLLPHAKNNEQEDVEEMTEEERSSTGSLLNIKWNCDLSLESCTCDEASWNGQLCGNCGYVYGLGPTFDCSSVGGPIIGPQEGENAEPNSAVEQVTTGAKTTDLPRPYREDVDFLALVDALSLTEASNMAGIPIGGAVPDTLEGMVEYVPLHYTMIVGENNMQWNSLLQDSETSLTDYNFTMVDAMIDYVKRGQQEHTILIRGHALIWGQSRGTTYPEVLASQVESSSTPDTTLIELMEQHMTVVAEHFSINSDGEIELDRSVNIWNVVNEHLSSRNDNNIFYTVLGDDYVKLSFEMARGLFPSSDDDRVRLVWNEAIDVMNDINDPTIQLWLELLSQYKEENVPIDGVGIQGHNIDELHNIDVLRELCQRIVDIGYDIELTEVDAPITLFMSSDDEEEGDPFERQGQFLASYAKACLDTGRCKGVTFWGLSDNATWYDTWWPETAPHLSLIVDEEGYPKPAWLHLRGVLEDHFSNNNDFGATSEEDEGTAMSLITDTNITVGNTTIEGTGVEYEIGSTNTTVDDEIEATLSSDAPSWSAGKSMFASGASILLSLSLSTLLFIMNL